MRPSERAELVVLAALWGASFLFMRWGAGDFGPVALSLVRVALAAAVLLPLVAWHGQWPPLRRHWRAIAVVGVVGSALPFMAFAYAAMVISAGMSSIVNATAPLWGATIAWLWLGERPSAARVAGLALGFSGVLWLLADKAAVRGGPDGEQAALAVLGCVAATLCYGISANATRRYLGGVPPLAVSAGSQAAATLALLVPGVMTWPAATPGARAWLAALALGLACTALAYLLYFRLIAHVGAPRAMTVTFLIPLFAMLWGGIVLGEAVTAVMVGACAVILAGTALATGSAAVMRQR
jgi:drug/metabolite transporter (DMT)-like permease